MGLAAGREGIQEDADRMQGGHSESQHAFFTLFKMCGDLIRFHLFIFDFTSEHVDGR